MKASDLFFTVSTTGSDGENRAKDITVSIEVYERRPHWKTNAPESWSEGERLFTVNSRAEYSGSNAAHGAPVHTSIEPPTFGFETAAEIDRFAYAVKLLLKNLANGRISYLHTTADEIQSALISAKVEYRVQDNRVDAYLLPEDVPPLDLEVWQAKPNHFNVLARNEAHAQEQALKQFGERVSKAYDPAKAANELTDWIAAGQPVENLTRQRFGRQAPDTRPLWKQLYMKTTPPAEDSEDDELAEIVNAIKEEVTQ